MKSALIYLLITKFKNKLKALVKSPGKIIFTIIIIALLVITIVGGKSAASDSTRKLRDINELYSIIFALFSIMFVLQAASGFNNGASMFSMADVNLIFTGPYKSIKVLFYGLVQQLSTSLLLGFFILFQYTTLCINYGVGFEALLAIFAGYDLTILLGQITAMVIYSFTSSDDRKKTVVKAIFYGILACFGLYAVICLFSGEIAFSALVTILTGPVFDCLPVAGWMSGAVKGLLSGNILSIVFGLGAGVVYVGLLLLFIIFYKTDYYEDVLKSTEVSFSAITSAKEGRMGEAAPANVKVGKIGIGNGYGAEAIYYKHLVENRRSRILMFDKTTIIFAITTFIFSFFMKEIGIVAVFAFSVYMQIFSVSLGRFVKELTRPYIYLIPEPPVKKMIYAIMEALPKFVLNAALIFIPVSFIIEMSPSDTIFAILAHISFSILFTSGNIVVERLWSGGSSKGLALLFYFSITILLTLPGIALSILAAIFGSGIPVLSAISQNSLIMLSLIVCNIPVALLAFFLCRNMLQYAEIYSPS
jgi:hypothetical protein